MSAEHSSTQLDVHISTCTHLDAVRSTTSLSTRSFAPALINLTACNMHAAVPVNAQLTCRELV